MKSSLLPALTGLALGVGAWAASTPPTLPLGSKAPDFDLPGVDGRNWRLSDFADAKILVVIFTCNHCPTAQYYEPRIKQLVTDYGKRGVVVVAISPNDPKSVRLDELGWADLSDTLEEMKIRARDREFNFPYLYDGDTQGVAQVYGPVSTPHAFVFDEARKLRYVGAIDDSERPQHVQVSYVRNALDALLRGEDPPVAQTRAVGCSVKWAGKAEGVAAYMAKLAEEPVTLEPVDAEGMKALRKGHGEKFRLVTFWSTLCAPCLVEFHEFVKMNRMYRHRDFEVVTVALDRPEDHRKVEAFLKSKEASMRNLAFGSSKRDELIEAFDPAWTGAVPYTVLLSPEGEVLRAEIDSIDPLAWRRAIVEAMNSRKPW